VPANAWGRLALVVATGGFLLLGFDVLAVFGAQVLDAALALAILWYTFRTLAAAKPGRIELATTWTEIVELLRVSIPFGLNALFVSVYLTVDVILVQLAWGDAEVGLYRGAVMLLTLLTIVAETLSTGIFPRMATHLGKPAEAGAELAFASRILLALAVPAAVGGMMTAEPLMVLFGGQAFASSAAPFILMAPLLPFRFLSNGAGMALSALDQQGDRTRGALIAAVLNVAVNLYVIPLYGAMGAAGTTLLTEIVLWAWMQWRVSKVVTGLGLPVTLVRVALPAAAMAGALWALPELPVILSIVVGIGVYGAGALLTGALDRRDLARLRGV
jgi:O-antigen/teichoic acid export membrane protein